MRKKVVIGIVILIIVIGLIIAALFTFTRSQEVMGEDWMDDEEMMVEKVKKRTLEETILVTGKIVPEDEQKIFHDGELGEIKAFKVKENASVKAGDVLFQYDGTELENELNASIRARDAAANSVQAAQNGLNQLNKQIEDMKKGLNQTSEEDDAGFTKEDLRELELEQTQQGLEIAGLKAEVEEAQGLINEIEKKRESLNVKAKIAGTVVKINKNVDPSGEGVSEAVIHIVSSGPFKVVGKMSEFDSVKIKPKQKVSIIPKVYKDRTWNGVIESVSEFPTEEAGDDFDMLEGDSNVTNYPFTVTMADDTSELRQGFHVSLEVNVGGDKKKVTVPHMAVFDDFMSSMDDEEMGMFDDMFGMDEGFVDDQIQYVFVVKDGILEQREIETGNMSDEYIEIISGVKADELIVINPMPNMTDGMEVESYDEVE